MNVKIYHNPRCSKSRQTLDLIRKNGIEPEIIEYLKTPPTKENLVTLLKALKLSDPRAMMRTKEDPYKTENLDNDHKSPDDLLGAIIEYPVLLERPIVVTDKGTRICRPPALVEEIL